jgi:RNA polymerase sigma-70 factor (ECF subfamily)
MLEKGDDTLMERKISLLQNSQDAESCCSAVPFEEFYEKHYFNVYRYVCKRIGVTEDAKDLTSEVFFACFKSYEKYDSTKSSLVSWLYVITNNRLKIYYRDKKNTEPIDDYLGDVALSYDDDLGQAAYIDELRDVLADALSELPERSRQIMVLKYFEDKSAEEIADILGLTPVNVRVIASRAIKQLKSFLSNNKIMEE